MAGLPRHAAQCSGVVPIQLVITPFDEPTRVELWSVRGRDLLLADPNGITRTLKFRQLDEQTLFVIWANEETNIATVEWWQLKVGKEPPPLRGPTPSSDA